MSVSDQRISEPKKTIRCQASVERWLFKRHLLIIIT